MAGTIDIVLGAAAPLPEPRRGEILEAAKAGLGGFQAKERTRRDELANLEAMKAPGFVISQARAALEREKTEGRTLLASFARSGEAEGIEVAIGPKVTLHGSTAHARDLDGLAAALAARFGLAVLKREEEEASD